MTSTPGIEAIPERAALNRWWFVALLLAAGAWRLWFALTAEMGPDEEFTVELASGSWRELFHKTAVDVHPPLYYAAMKWWFLFMPPTLLSAKLLTILFSMGTIAAVAMLARRWVGCTAAWCAALTMAFAPYQAYWGQVARNHQLLPLLVLLVALCTDRWRESNRRRDLVLLALAWAAAMYTNYLSLLFAPVWALALLADAGPTHWRGWVPPLVAAGAAFISFLWWVPWMLPLLKESPFFLVIFQDGASPFFLWWRSVFAPAERYPAPVDGVVFYLSMVLFAVVTVFGARKLGPHPGRWIIVLLTPVVPVAVAHVRELPLATRHLAFAIPLFMILWGAGVAELLEKLQNRFGKKSGGAVSSTGRPN